jgi:hypothetical protein
MVTSNEQQQAYMTLGRLLVLIKPTIPAFVASQILVNAGRIVTVKFVLVAKALCKEKHAKKK